MRIILRSHCGQEFLISYELLFPFLFFSLNVLLHIPVLPFPSAIQFQSSVLSKCLVPHFSFQNPPEIVRRPSSSALPSTFLSLPFPPMYFLSLLHFLLPTSLSSRASQMFCPALSLPKFSWACSRFLLQHSSFPFPLPFPSVLPCNVDLTWIVFFSSSVTVVRFLFFCLFYCCSVKIIALLRIFFFKLKSLFAI